MHEIELAFDGSTPVAHFDAAGIAPSSASVSLVSPTGAVVASPTVALPSLSTTTTAATNTTLTLASVTGLRRGSHLSVSCDGVLYVCEVSSVDGSVVHLTAGLPVAVDTGSVVKHLDMTATVTAPGSALLGGNYRLVWSYSDGATTGQMGYPAAVVRWPWSPVVTPADVRSHMVDVYSDSRRSESWCLSVAQRADSHVRSALASVQRRPWLFLSSQIFSEAGAAAMRYELALAGICHGGQIYDAQRETRYAMTDSIAKVLTSLAGYDSNADGKTSDEPRPLGQTIRVVL